MLVSVIVSAKLKRKRTLHCFERSCLSTNNHISGFYESLIFQVKNDSRIILHQYYVESFTPK